MFHLTRVCVCVFMQQKKTGVDKRECCLQEIRQTEEKYSDTLQSILQVCTPSDLMTDRFTKQADICTHI